MCGDANDSDWCGGMRQVSVFFVGLDLGKAQNHTALSVIERREMVYYGRDPVTQAFRTELGMCHPHLQRIPLDTPYPDIVEFVRRVVSRPELGGGRWADVRWWWMRQGWALRWWTCCGRLGCRARWCR